MNEHTSAILVARGLAFGYDPAVPVLRGVDLSAWSGKLLCMLGPNGSGKTTALRCLLGQLTPDSGTIHLADQPLADYGARGLAKMMAYVPQFPTSAFAFTARQLVMMGRLPHTGALGVTGEEDDKVADLAMEMTESLVFSSRTLDELSGGEAQRVMIARALAQQPSVLLLDEPTSHLDIRHQITIYRMMVRLARDWGIAVVCVSHDVNLAGRFADELLLMKDGQVLAQGVPRDVIRADVLSQAYDVQVELIDSPGRDMPIVRAT